MGTIAIVGMVFLIGLGVACLIMGGNSYCRISD